MFMPSKIPEINVEDRAYIKIRSLIGDTPRNIFNDLSEFMAVMLVQNLPSRSGVFVFVRGERR